jgi:hypothetical protein
MCFGYTGIYMSFKGPLRQNVMFMKTNLLDLSVLDKMFKAEQTKMCQGCFGRKFYSIIDIIIIACHFQNNIKIVHRII